MEYINFSFNLNIITQIEIYFNNIYKCLKLNKIMKNYNEAKLK